VTETQSTVIAVTGLTKTFGNLYALRNLSFSLNKGEFLTIFGPNGAGKTTLIRILSTITKASSGEIKIADLSFEDDSEKIRRQIGVIAHQTFLYENLTAEENLRFYGKLYDVKNLSRKIETILSEVGLELRKRDFVRTFSRGMQQRLAIARAMLHEPSILLLDEPYTGLDQHASGMLTNWLNRLRSSEQTILMVTHDLEQGMELADRIAILVNGQLVFNQEQRGVDVKKFRQTYYDLVEKNKA
jgi:heme exporter protein A